MYYMHSFLKKGLSKSVDLLYAPPSKKCERSANEVRKSAFGVTPLKRRYWHTWSCTACSAISNLRFSKPCTAGNCVLCYCSVVLPFFRTFHRKPNQKYCIFQYYQNCEIWYFLLVFLWTNLRNWNKQFGTCPTAYRWYHVTSIRFYAYVITYAPSYQAWLPASSDVS